LAQIKLARRDQPETVVAQGRSLPTSQGRLRAANWTKAHGNRRFEWHVQLFKRLQTRSIIFISDQTGFIPTQNRVHWLSWPSSAQSLGGALVKFAA
jgi:hypothetical protein